MEYRENAMKAQKENKEKKESVNDEEIAWKCSSSLPNIIKADLKIANIYTWVINNEIQNKIAYVSLDQEQKIKGRIKVEDKNQLKQYKKWDIIKVKIEEISEEEGKLLSLSLVPTKE
jgi:hypothetical protein